MSPERWQQVNRVFQEARQRSPDDRNALLDQACAGDDDLRARVQELLGADETDTRGPFLAPVAVNVKDMMPTLPAADEPVAAVAIEGYSIVRELSHGGQGVVYQAIQHSTKQKVAIKLLLAGAYASRSALRRFEREIELVASLKHPNIISILHSDQTSDGRRYCVMDYVRGVPLNRFVREKKLSLTKVLELFAIVCDAIQYAHQRGVIHRDLKPSNILVDSAGVPKVLDFGLAKLIGGPEGTLISITGQVVGTLPYMSPEQARGDPDEMDTRTDIYSLGVILYELLTGHFPYEVNGQMADVLKRITESPPAAPSLKWEAGRGVPGRQLRKRRGETRETSSVPDSRRRGSRSRSPIDDEVQTIVFKTLAKERERRYQSAGELARDIRNYLRGQPIVAKAPSVPYRLRKFVSRNRIAVGSAAMVFLALVAGTVVSTCSAIQAIRSKNEARREADNAMAITDFLRNMLQSPEPRLGSGADVRVVDALDRAVPRIEAMYGDQPEVEATLRQAVGDLYFNLARFDEAEAQLRRALDIRTKRYGTDNLANVETLTSLALIDKNLGRFEVAETRLEHCLDIQTREFGAESEPVGATTHQLAMLYRRMGRLGEAETLFRKAQALARRFKGDHDPDLAVSLTQLGKLLADKREYDEAEARLREALAIFRQPDGGGPANAALALAPLARVLRETGRLDEAESVAREAAEIRRATYGDDSPVLASALAELAYVQKERDELDEAESLLREALRIYRAAYGDSHEFVATTRHVLAAVLDEEGNSEAAIDLFQKAIEGYEATRGPDHWLVAAARKDFGVCLMHLGRYEQAGEQLLTAHTILVAAGQSQRAHTAASRLAELYKAWGDDEQAAHWQSVADAHD